MGERYRKGREQGNNALRGLLFFSHSLVQETASEPDSLLETVHTDEEEMCLAD